MSEIRRVCEESPQYLTDTEILKFLGITAPESINFKALCKMSFDELVGAGYSKACARRVIALCEASRRIEYLTEYEPAKINSPEDVYRLIYPQLRDDKREHFIILCPNTKNHVIKQQTISIGSLNANIVHPREVFKTALLTSAANIIAVHNHPSGEPTPSREDIEITKKLVESGKMIGIEMLDHVIIGELRHFSMKEAGHI